MGEGGVAAQIDAEMMPRVFGFERDRAGRRREPENPDAWDLLLRGMWHSQRLNAEDNRKARDLFERVVKLEPALLLAHERLGMTHYQDLFYQWSRSPKDSLRALEGAAKTCVELDGHDPCGHVLQGLVEIRHGKAARALASLEFALSRNPSDSATHSILGQLLALTGQVERAREHLETAIRLSPRDPELDLFYFGLAIVCFVEADYEKAIDWAQQSLRLKLDFVTNRLVIASACGHLGRRSDADVEIDTLLETSTISADDLRELLLVASRPHQERFFEGLRLAGFPDEYLPTLS